MQKDLAGPCQDMAWHWKRVADGHGTGFCPLECPVRPNDPIVNTDAHAHADICEVSEFEREKEKENQDDWQVYNMVKYICA